MDIFKNEVANKILDVYLNIYVFIELVSVNIVLGLALNHFNMLNWFTGAVLLTITILSTLLCAAREKHDKQ